MSAFPGVAVAEQAIDLVEAGMDAMGEEDGLLRLVTLLTTEADTQFHHPPAEGHKDQQAEGGDIILIAVERDLGFRGDAAFFFGEPFEVDIEQIETADAEAILSRWE